MKQKKIMGNIATVYIPAKGETQINWYGETVPAEWGINCAATGTMTISEAEAFAREILAEIDCYKVFLAQK